MADPAYLESTVYHRELEDGRIIMVYPRMYNTILTIGPVNMPIYDQHW